MLVKQLFVLASIGLAAVNAQKFEFKETYPAPYTVPTPKPEWLDLIKSASIANAPILKESGGVLQLPTGGDDPFCLWSATQCLGKDDVFTCPDGQWSLTFDDGPSEYTPKLLDFLKQNNLKATFFVVGGQVLQYPEILKRAYDEGHEIAMHSWSHKNMATLTNEQLVGELKWNELAIKEVIGVSPRFFRPPFGNIDNRVRDIIRTLGFTPVIWSVDTNDWYLTEHSDTFNPNWITGNVTQWTKTEKGGNSLSHDLYEQTVAAALDYAPVLGKAFKLTSVGDCNALSSYTNGNGTAVNPPPTASKSGDKPAATDGPESKDKDSDKKKEEEEQKEEDAKVKAQQDAESGAPRFAVSSSAALMLAAAVAFIAN